MGAAQYRIYYVHVCACTCAFVHVTSCVYVYVCACVHLILCVCECVHGACEYVYDFCMFSSCVRVQCALISV